MDTEYFAFSMGRLELTEIHRSLLERFILEETLRQAHGLESINYPETLLKIEGILGLTSAVTQKISQDVEEELWEYAWHTYTEEWAWHRATQDADKLLNKKNLKPKNRETFIQELFDKRFTHYTSEIDMHEITKRLKKSSRRKSKK